MVIHNLGIEHLAILPSEADAPLLVDADAVLTCAVARPRPRGQTAPVLPSRGIAMNHLIDTGSRAGPWNKGKLVGQKAPLRLKDIWAIRIRLQLGSRIRELALFNLAIDCKLRSCDLVKLRVRDLVHGERIAERALVMQQNTQRPVQFEITEQTRESLGAWIRQRGLRGDDFLFPSRLRRSPHLSIRQYARIVRHWVGEIGLDPTAYGTHTLRRTKVSLIDEQRIFGTSSSCSGTVGWKAR